MQEGAALSGCMHVQKVQTLSHQSRLILVNKLLHHHSHLQTMTRLLRVLAPIVQPYYTAVVRERVRRQSDAVLRLNLCCATNLRDFRYILQINRYGPVYYCQVWKYGTNFGLDLTQHDACCGGTCGCAGVLHGSTTWSSKQCVSITPTV